VYKIGDRIIMVSRDAESNDPYNGSYGTIRGGGPRYDRGGAYYEIDWESGVTHPHDDPGADYDTDPEDTVYADQIAPAPEYVGDTTIAVAVAAPHYGDLDDPHASINVIEAWGLGYHLGNVIKYVKRAGHKPGNPAVQDLRKAAWYLERAIANLESGAE
jgi:hypothetical protein